MVVVQDAHERSQVIIRLATAAIVGYGAFLPLVNLIRLALDPLDPAAPASTLYATLATAVYLPLQMWLVVAALRDTHHRAQRWAAAGVAVVVLGMIPVLGIDWLGAVYSVVIAVLLVVRPPFSLMFLVALTALVVGVSLTSGRVDAALFFGMGPPVVATTAAVPIWLLRSVRGLAATQAALAEAAVVRERVRIADELRSTVDSALADIVAAGDRVTDLVDRDMSAATGHLRALVTESRRTLSNVRRMLAGYQEVSLRAEVETAATLLRASGIRTVVELPAGDLPPADEAVRAGLRRDISRVLRDPVAGKCTITVATHEGHVSVTLRERVSFADDMGDR